ncbi:MAG: GGDEF domain-containing protein [Acholeplasmatales bacterium]|nr:GGDEF domain-containing protein [Acholeplasmatales bacterium]
MNNEKLSSIEFFNNQDLEFAFDGLTKVLSREMITSYLSYLIQNKKTFTVCLCDVDNFKSVNDNYGHMLGDEILQILAENIEKTVGNKGVVGRYGGDEFMIILDGITEYNDVWEVCHKINVSAGKLKYEKAEELNVTLTTGIVRYPIDGQTYEELLSKADRALYRGKMKGRNCFIIYLAAKHANILIEPNKEKLYSSMEMLSRVFNILNAGDDLKRNIKSAIQYLSSYLMIDHICLQSMSKICVEQIHSLSVVKEFEFIDNDLIFREMNSSGLFFLNARKTLMQTGSTTLHALLKNQQIYSFLSFKIESNGKQYGIIRADSTNIKVWQAAEMDLFVVAAKLIGVLLDKANTDLDELFK